MSIRLFDKLFKYTSSFLPGPKFFTTKTSDRIYHYTPTAFNIMNEPEVTVKQGKLKGSVKKLLDGSVYYSFKGIPYAEAPVGHLRFTAPQPPLPWKGTYNATDHGAVCPQFDMMTRDMVEGDEKCLFLNVYTRNLPIKKKVPVMVYIHGGAYMSGSGNANAGLGPEFLLQHDVVIVTINYRLEVLGFLCLDTPEVPGNAGMKDQVYALRWVKDNIAEFGGDPDNVTIFGESAGGSSVTFHMHSPMSKGLFHKAIAQSGVSLCDWSLGQDAKGRAFRLGKALGKETNDVTELLNFFRSLPATDLSKATIKSMTYDEKHRGLPIHFAPVVEKKFEGVEQFLVENPLDNLFSKKVNNVPIIVGYNSEEGLVVLSDKLKKLSFINEHPEFFVPREISEKLPSDRVKQMGSRIRDFYFGKKEITKNDRQKIATSVSDINFVYNIHRFAHFYSNIETTYLYKFDLQTELNIAKNYSIAADLQGASHTDDLYYFFYVPMNEEHYKEKEELREIVYDVTKLWTDFAKTGKPTPNTKLPLSQVQWNPYNASTRDYLNINNPMTPGQFADKERIEFWNKLYNEAGLPSLADHIKSNL